MPRPPIDPDSFDKVNFVIDAWTTGCDAPWYLYIETMKPAALAAFITLITFGWDDVARGFARPKGLDRRRTGKRKGKWAKARPRFPELGELLGGKLPGADEVKGMKWSDGLKTLWRIDAVMQQALFWWLVADVAEEFAFAWTSLLYESYWCQPDPQGRFSFRRSGFFAIPQYSWSKRGFGEEDYLNSPPWWGFNQGSTSGNPAQITAALRLQERVPFGKPTSLQVRIQNDATGEVYGISDQADADANGDASVPVSALVPPWTAFHVRARMLGAAWANVGDGVVVGVEVTQ